MSHFKPTLANEYAYATECQLATLSGLLGKKSSAKSEIKRQANICLRMLGICRSETGSIEWGSEWRHNFGRVQKIILAGDLEASLNAWMADPSA